MILGGVLTDFLSWRWALLINVPVGIVVVIAIGRLVEETCPKPARLDIAGALTATFGSVGLVYGSSALRIMGGRLPSRSCRSSAPRSCSSLFSRSKSATISVFFEIALVSAGWQ